MKTILRYFPLTLLLCVLAPTTKAEAVRDANEAMKAASDTAKADGKNIFLIFGTPSCGWCKVFDRYHTNAAVSPVFDKFFVWVKVDLETTKGGRKLHEQFGVEPGVPSWTVLSPAGKVLANSNGGAGNVGYPLSPEETEHYVRVLKVTCPRITDAETQLLASKIKEVAGKK